LCRKQAVKVLQNGTFAAVAKKLKAAAKKRKERNKRKTTKQTIKEETCTAILQQALFMASTAI
jgi:hypothetical protein